jgi:predicted metalloenzyme YecM
MKIDEIVGDINIFLDKIFLNIQNTGFDFSELDELDHIAYRVEDNKRYDEVKNQLKDFVEYIDEAMFGGRLISILKLKAPIKYKNYRIDCLELMAPKENNTFKEGLEHAEFVISINLADYREKYKDLIDFNLDGYRREVNPELIAEFEDCAVKFHNQSLLKVRGLA